MSRVPQHRLRRTMSTAWHASCAPRFPAPAPPAPDRPPTAQCSCRPPTLRAAGTGITVSSLSSLQRKLWPVERDEHVRSMGRSRDRQAAFSCVALTTAPWRGPNTSIRSAVAATSMTVGRTHTHTHPNARTLQIERRPAKFKNSRAADPQRLWPESLSRLKLRRRGGCLCVLCPPPLRPARGLFISRPPLSSFTESRDGSMR